MITIFVKTGCPFCARALAVLDAYGLQYTEKNVSDPAVVDELIAIGGKKQEPFLIDGEVTMYDSKNIIEYIERTYGTGEVKKITVRTAPGGEVCPS